MGITSIGGAIGRFMQADPVGYSAGPNLYTYVSGDPVNRVDPTGAADIIVTARDSIANGVPAGGGGLGLGYTGSTTVDDNGWVITVWEVKKPSRQVAPGGGVAEPSIPGECSSLPGFAEMDELARSLMSKFDKRNNPIPWLRGIFIHVQFSLGVALLGPNHHINVSYKGGAQAGWFDLGSVRPDAVYGNPERPLYVVELKTGNARLKDPQLSNYLKNLPKPPRICEIYEK
ncbi:RHS repeat-associated core domain-containing protein [Sphingomonas zeicaulis]|uniref:RHS repeat-associated core domain-containing protein n=1 Tax=Sphingomonas zeicaulis TaxID=1632740 RepID=UPI003D226661